MTSGGQRGGTGPSHPLRGPAPLPQAPHPTPLSHTALHGPALTLPRGSVCRAWRGAFRTTVGYEGGPCLSSPDPYHAGQGRTEPQALHVAQPQPTQPWSPSLLALAPNIWEQLICILPHP